MNFLKFTEVLYTSLLSKTRVSLVAKFSFIINITKIDHNCGAPAAGRFH